MMNDALVVPAFAELLVAIVLRMLVSRDHGRRGREREAKEEEGRKVRRGGEREEEASSRYHRRGKMTEVLCSCAHVSISYVSDGVVITTA